jgi:hypothetical protein
MWANTEYAPEGDHVSIYRTCTPSYGIEKKKRPEAQPYIMCLVCSSVVLLGRETGPLQLLVPLLLTGGNGADLVIRGNVVLNTLSARSTSTLLRNHICIDSPSSWQVPRPSRTVLRDRLRFSLYVIERYVYLLVCMNYDTCPTKLLSLSWCCARSRDS